MSPNLNTEETAALRELLGSDAESRQATVATRDFGEPRRLSAAQITRLSRLAGSCLTELCADLTGILRTDPAIGLRQVSEVSSTGLFQDLGSNFLVYQFELKGNTAWLIWESAPAVAVVETVLAGAAQEEPTARQLSVSECRIVRQLLGQVAHRLLDSISLPFDPSTASIAQNRDELLTMADSGPDSDPQRLFMHLDFEGPGGQSDMRLYLPGIDPERVEEIKAEAIPLPDHLGEVSLDVAAFLGSIDVPLTELLDLEVGDVIPLELPVGSMIDVYVEDRACGKARWGRKDGRLAMRVEELCPHPSTIENPETDDRVGRKER